MVMEWSWSGHGVAIPTTPQQSPQSLKTENEMQRPDLRETSMDWTDYAPKLRPVPAKAHGRSSHSIGNDGSSSHEATHLQSLLHQSASGSPTKRPSRMSVAFKDLHVRLTGIEVCARTFERMRTHMQPPCVGECNVECTRPGEWSRAE